LFVCLFVCLLVCLLVCFSMQFFFFHSCRTKLVTKFHETNGQAKFSKLDYVARTPSWALYGAPEAGFSPYEVHFKRSANGRTVTNEKSATAKDIAKGTSVGIEDYDSGNEGEGGCG
jgi:hypothetical protein